MSGVASKDSSVAKPRLTNEEAKASISKLPVSLQPFYNVDLVKDVQALIDYHNRTGERVSGLEKINAMLVASKLAEKKRVKPENVGIDPENREHHGAGAAKSQTHGAKILKSGWSWNKCSDAAGFQAPPECAHLEASNRTAEALSAGLIPPFRMIDMTAMGTTHTNVFLRQVKGGVRALLPELADQHGNLNLEYLSQNRPEFRDAVEDGIVWLQLH